jgi:hypothetical protein
MWIAENPCLLLNLWGAKQMASLSDSVPVVSLDLNFGQIPVVFCKPGRLDIRTQVVFCPNQIEHRLKTTSCDYQHHKHCFPLSLLLTTMNLLVAL